MNKLAKVGCVVAGLALMGGSAAYAAIPDANGVIHGCRANATGDLYVRESSCPTGFTALDWSQSGPAGPQGPQGPQGETGPQGPAGVLGETHVYPSESFVTPNNSPMSENFSCPGDEKLLSGGVAIAQQNDNLLRIIESRPVTQQTWTASVKGDAGVHWIMTILCAE